MDGISFGADTELLCVTQVQISLLCYCWGPLVTGNTGNTGNTGYVSLFFQKCAPKMQMRNHGRKKKRRMIPSVRTECNVMKVIWIDVNTYIHTKTHTLKHAVAQHTSSSLALKFA